MGKLEEAVVLTKKYAAFFGSRLSQRELHRWLISDKTYSEETIKKLFPKGTKVRPDHSEAKKFALARKVAKFLAFIPTVSSVAITGSLAINNSKPGDDIDLFIITRPDTLWLTRLLIVPLVGFFFKRRLPAKAAIKNSICLNLWLDESALAVPANKRNLYTAHEVLQAYPMFDKGGVYRHFLLANRWTAHYLANAYDLALKSGPGQAKKTRGTNPSRRRGEVSTVFAWPNRILKSLNAIAFKLQYLYMKKRITHETVTLHSAYFHPRDLFPKLNQHLGIY